MTFCRTHIDTTIPSCCTGDDTTHCEVVTKLVRVGKWLMRNRRTLAEFKLIIDFATRTVELSEFANETVETKRLCR